MAAWENLGVKGGLGFGGELGHGGGQGRVILRAVAAGSIEEKVEAHHPGTG